MESLVDIESMGHIGKKLRYHCSNFNSPYPSALPLIPDKIQYQGGKTVDLSGYLSLDDTLLFSFSPLPIPCFYSLFSHSFRP